MPTNSVIGRIRFGSGTGDASCKSAHVARPHVPDVLGAQSGFVWDVLQPSSFDFPPVVPPYSLTTNDQRHLLTPNIGMLLSTLISLAAFLASGERQWLAKASPV